MPKRRKVPWPIMKTQLTKECRDRFGRRSLRLARRSFSLRDCCPNDLQQNLREGFSKTPRVVRKYPRAGLFVSAFPLERPHRNGFKIQFMKFNLMVPVDCE